MTRFYTRKQKDRAGLEALIRRVEADKNYQAKTAAINAWLEASKDVAADKASPHRAKMARALEMLLDLPAVRAL